MSLTFARALAMAADLPASPSPREDVEALLSHVTGKGRTTFYTWPEQALTPAQVDAFLSLLARRQQGEPVAYLTGERGFRDLLLEVNSHTLIPRPDTELLVEAALDRGDEQAALRVLDLGTGSGAIALAIAQEWPAWSVVAVDRSEAALEVARRNARRHGLAGVAFLQSDWFAGVAGRFDMIVANPPYIADDDPHLLAGDLRFEPRSALAAGSDGLDDLRQIIAVAPGFLHAGGWLLLEHGYHQADGVARLLAGAGFECLALIHDYGGQPRISLGRRCA